jgi:Ca-activated chloride channel homolog
VGNENRDEVAVNIFANASGVYLLFLLPLLLALAPVYFFVRRRRRQQWGGDLMDNYSFAPRRRFVFLRMSLFAAAVASLFLAFARPQWGEVENKTAVSDLDVIVLFDVSRSMNVEDIRPSRLERARMEVKSLIEKLEGARMGLVAFSALPIILSPLTDDKSALELLFEIADTKLIPAQGTDLGKGIEEALRLFPYDEERSRVMIVFSDGEDMGVTSFKAAGAAQNLQVKIFTVGLGTAEGGIVKNEKGNAVIDPQTARDARSSLDSTKLKQVSAMTDGRYFEIGKEGQTLGELRDELSRIKKREYATKQREKREEKFGFFAAAGLLLLFIIPFVPLSRREERQ